MTLETKKKNRIITQESISGPCSLVAIANVLILEGRLMVPYLVSPEFLVGIIVSNFEKELTYENIATMHSWVNGFMVDNRNDQNVLNKLRISIYSKKTVNQMQEGELNIYFNDGHIMTIFKVNNVVYELDNSENGPGSWINIENEQSEGNVVKATPMKVNKDDIIQNITYI